MVAYSFKSRFAPLIFLGLKRQTIRGGRARHARPGEMLQLFVGMRTAKCHKICTDVRCTSVRPILIAFEPQGAIEGILVDGFAPPDLDDFAREDGFADLLDMETFWHRENSPVGLWHGFLIQWEPPVSVIGALP